MEQTTAGGASGCFLVADEVGLGKTRIARTVAFEMARMNGRAAVFYLASNARIARNNIKDFDGTNREISHIREENFRDLTGCQRAAAERALAAFGYGDGYVGSAERAMEIRRAPETFRLSMAAVDRDVLASVRPSGNQGRGFCITFPITPRTSFNTDAGLQYTGSQDERSCMEAALRQAARFCEKRQEAEENGEVIRQEPVSEAVLLAAAYQKFGRRPGPGEWSGETACRELQDHLTYLLDLRENKEYAQMENSRFRRLRQIMSNAAACLLKPDLIVADEFQRYRGFLENTGNGYSVLTMLRFMRAFPEIFTRLPKILLLSATPYDYDHNAFAEMEPEGGKEPPWLSGDSAGRTEKRTGSEGPYSDFNELKAAMIELGGRTERTADFMSRTERNMFFQEEDRKLYEDFRVPELQPEQYKKHLNYIQSVLRGLCGVPSGSEEEDGAAAAGGRTGAGEAADMDGRTGAGDAADMDGRTGGDGAPGAEGPEAAAVVGSCISHTPHFWKFSGDYKKMGRLFGGGSGTGGPDQLTKQAHAALEELDRTSDPYDHILLQTLIRECMPEGAENLLWVPPSRGGGANSGFGALSAYGKTLVFARYRMSSRSAAYYVSREANARLERRLTEQWEDGSEDLCCGQAGELRTFLAETPCGDLCDEETTAALLAFFNQTYCKKVVCSLYGSYTEKTVIRYCREYCLKEVLAEYYEVCGAGGSEDFHRKLRETLAGDAGGKGMWMGQVNGYALTFSAQYTDDPDENGGHRDDFQMQMQERFNSPFYPMVLAATGTAQEGLDLHKYADKLMHWHTAANANAFMQREGRLDRPNSLIIRRRLAELCSRLEQDGSDQAEALRRRMTDRLREADLKGRPAFFGIVQEHALRIIEEIRPRGIDLKQLALAAAAGIFPKWYIPALTEESPRIRRIAAPTLLSGQKELAEKIHSAAKNYPEFLGGAEEWDREQSGGREETRSQWTELRKRTLCAFFDYAGNIAKRY
ncbi:hypothetical protein [Bacilliculturomica massiliensis]|uniref:hypothetical protein n=1 Tax=Bacilliculturomica massiliensis TaxID=1917867 RepID=UPI0010326D38|nr:hypothetical protein [Bacilliculturomica massiliensis]